MNDISALEAAANLLRDVDSLLEHHPAQRTPSRVNQRAQGTARCSGLAPRCATRRGRCTSRKLW